MACLCCARKDRKMSTSSSLGIRTNSVYQIEHMDSENDDLRHRNAQQVRLQLMLTEELSSETYGLELAKKERESYEAQDFFTFKEILGSGATAVVFRAIFKPTGANLAIKFIPNFKTAKAMVMRELMVLKRANDSRFLIDFHSHFRVGPNLYFVMEICEGGTLHELLQPKYHLPSKLMKIYLKEICSAVFFLHGLKLVHRDLAPDNLFIDSTGHLKLGDFGLCRMVDDPQGELMTDCGKPYIKAPEVYMDKPCSFPIDWWSVGIMVYRFITGYYPFKTEKLTQGYQSVTKHQEKYPEWAFVDPTAKALCQGLLNKKPRERLACENEESVIKNHPYFQGVNWTAKEDVVALALKMVEPGEELPVPAVAQRLLKALGVPDPSLVAHPLPAYPPPKGAIAMIKNTALNTIRTSVEKEPLKLLSLLPKGDGYGASNAKQTSTIQETTV
ncbi:hypothetical protein EGW08_004410 [Elysia chlorotica]|uniref:Protein kinase domain-containing protein n=1 Tax=Elysia chlorotica TaxID=188477 RepID=A0A433U1W7_ELYCH|nr:hypothetical protein EGW08_004410 [Elysia chlorotica]